MSDKKKTLSFVIHTPQQNGNTWVEHILKSSDPEEFKRQYFCDFHLELPKCHVCGTPSKSFCTKTPAGGWGNVKCGRPICLDCKCDCQEPTL